MFLGVSKKDAFLPQKKTDNTFHPRSTLLPAFEHVCVSMWCLKSCRQTFCNLEGRGHKSPADLAPDVMRLWADASKTYLVTFGMVRGECLFL